MKARRTSGLALCGWSLGWDRKWLTLLIPFVASSGSPAALTLVAVDIDLDVEGLLVWTMWQTVDLSQRLDISRGGRGAG